MPLQGDDLLYVEDASGSQYNTTLDDIATFVDAAGPSYDVERPSDEALSAASTVGGPCRGYISLIVCKKYSLYNSSNTLVDMTGLSGGWLCNRISPTATLVPGNQNDANAITRLQVNGGNKSADWFYFVGVSGAEVQIQSTKAHLVDLSNCKLSNNKVSGSAVGSADGFKLSATSTGSLDTLNIGAEFSDKSKVVINVKPDNIIGADTIRWPKHSASDTEMRFELSINSQDPEQWADIVIGVSDFAKTDTNLSRFNTDSNNYGLEAMSAFTNVVLPSRAHAAYDHLSSLSMKFTRIAKS